MKKGYLWCIGFVLLFSIIITICFFNLKQGNDNNLDVLFEETVSAKEEFTIDEMLADYDELWEMLEENYYYFPYLESQGIDVESLKRMTRQQLENRISNVDGFIYLLDFMFKKMNNFAHLSVVSPEMIFVYQTYYNSEGVGDNGWKNTLQNPQTAALYEYLNKVPFTENSELITEQVLPDIEVELDLQRKIVIFKIRTFDDKIYKKEKGFINEYLTSLDNAKIDHIIFDICGNAGGNDAYWMENIVAPFGGSYEWDTWCYLRDTELMREYFFDDYTPELISELSGHAVPADVKQLGLTHYFKRQQTLSTEATFKKNITNAKRWVIIDNRVYSSADSFSAFCKATGWATLVGQSTRGCGTGSTPILISLPNTGLLVRFSGIVVETYEGTLNVLAGTKPDIQVDPIVGNCQYVINQLVD